MPDAKITDLPDGGDPQDTDDFVVARGATNNKIAWSSMSNAVATAVAGSQINVTADGNTAGALALISSGTMTLAGGNNITLSQAGNAVTISGPNVGGAQTGISGIANSETTYTSGTVSLSELGAITIRSTTGQQFQFSVNPQSVQPETQTFIGGVNASDTLYTSGSVRFTGSQAVTVRSGTGQLVIIDAPAQSVQPETQTFVAGISASDTLYTSGNVRFTGVGGGVTVSSNTGQRVDISVAAQSVQPETQTFLAGIQNSQTTYTSGTVNLSVNGGLLTIRSTTGQAFQFSVSQSVQPETQTFVAGIQNSQTTYTSGTVNLSVVGGNLTIRSTTGQAFQFSMSQTVQPETQTAISGIANSQTTYTSGTVSLSELGAITIRSTTGNQYQFSVNAQTTQTQGVINAGVSTGGNTSGDTTVNSGTRLVFVGSNNITLSQGTAANATTITVSGPATHAQQTGISGIANSQTTYTSGTVSLSELGAITIRSTTGNQYQLSVNAQTTQTQGILNAGVSTGGNTSGDTGANSGTRLVFAGGNNITLSQGTAANATTITISAPNLGAGAMSAGASNLGNTAGSTGITGTQLVLVGSGPVSLSQSTGANGGTLSINAPATSSLSATGIVSISTNGSTISIGASESNQSGNVYASSNTFGTSSGTYDARTLSIAGSGGVSVAASNSGWVISAPSPQTAAYWENMPAMEPVLYTLLGGVTKTPFYWHENLPQGIKPANIAIRVSMVTANSDLSASVHFGVYTFVNSTSAALLGSGSDAFVVSSASSVSFSAQRNLVLTSPGTVAAISSLTPGNYLFGMMFSATNTNAINASIYAASAAAGPRVGRIMPGTNQLSTGTSQGIAGLVGRGSTTVNALPANVGASDLVNQGIGASSPMKPYIFIRS